MFGRNTYLLNPQASPSHHPRSVVDLNGVEILLHHGHPEMFSSHFLAANNTPPVVDSSLLHQDNGRAGLNNGDPNCGISANAFQRKQTSGKKDRHSKIFTSQGPRDRRVRLSIGIARKFFDLQEMLGFDKPSKTLDWLLTKSKAAIKDLVQSKQNSAKSISSPSECEVLSSAENGNYLMGADYSKKKLSNKSKGPAKDPQQVAASNLAKESRAKARARARERTIEKMCIKQMNGACKINGSVSDLNPYRNNENQLEGFQLSAKNPSFFGFHQQNYTIPSANTNTSTSENWDICSFTSQSNISAILDHHKFN